MFDIEKMRKDREQGLEKLSNRFGSKTPEMSDLCSRCQDRYGNHYGTDSHLYCPDEWVAEGHSLV